MAGVLETKSKLWTIPLDVGFSQWSEFWSEYPFLSAFSTLSIKQHANFYICTLLLLGESRFLGK